MTTGRFNHEGLPIYPRGGAPFGLLLERQLRDEHDKKPGGPPRAVLDMGVAGVDLYSVDEAVPLSGDDE